MMMQPAAYNEDYKASEDYELWCRAIKCTKLENLSEILLKYIKHPNGNSKNPLAADYDSKLKQSIMNLLTDDKTLQNLIYDVLDKYSKKNLTLWEKFFSVRGISIRGNKWKCLTIFGITIKLIKK